MQTLDATDWFAPRHIGPSPDERDRMLQTVGASSLDALIDEAIPLSIRLTTPLNLSPPESEHQYLRRLALLAHRNTAFRSYIGLGYHDTITPSVVLRIRHTRRIRLRSPRVASSRSSTTRRWCRS
jgi:glycine dehydrogenase